MTTYDKEVQLIEQWLEDKHVTLWAVFDVVNLDTRRKAAEWLHHELTSVTEFAMARQEDW